MTVKSQIQPLVPDPRTRAQRIGAYGEQVAARHLVGQGMVILDRNWRGEAGELDLVLRDGDVLVVCEVKTRSSEGWGSPLEAVGRQKAERLRRLAAQWIQVHGVRVPEVRLDLVGVLRTPGGPVVEHVRAIGG